MDIELKFAGIYAIRHNTSGKVYVGQSRCLATRIKDHRRGSSCINLRHAIECDGWSAFTVEVLERVDDVALLNEREQYWIDRFQSYHPEYGYNATSRAHGPNEETRAKMRAAKLGKKLSPEHIANITQNHVRGKHSKTHTTMTHTTIFLMPQDELAIEVIKECCGLSSKSDAIRLALRTVARGGQLLTADEVRTESD